MSLKKKVPLFRITCHIRPSIKIFPHWLLLFHIFNSLKPFLGWNLITKYKFFSSRSYYLLIEITQLYENKSITFFLLSLFLKVTLCTFLYHNFMKSKYLNYSSNNVRYWLIYTYAEYYLEWNYQYMLQMCKIFNLIYGTHVSQLTLECAKQLERIRKKKNKTGKFLMHKIILLNTKKINFYYQRFIFFTLIWFQCSTGKLINVYLYFQGSVFPGHRTFNLI
jgi:hypothetical protein